MTKIISYYPKSGYKLPSSVAGAGNSTTEATKRQPGADCVDDAVKIFFMHFIVTFIMVVFSIVPAFDNWRGHWPCFAIHGIVYLYSTVMIKLRGQKKSSELEKDGGCGEEIATGSKMQFTSMLMLVATGVMFIFLGLMVLVFRSDWNHLESIAFSVSVSTSLMLFILAVGEFEWERKLRERSKDPMDLV